MLNIKVLMDPVLRNKMSAKIDNPSGDVLKEISLQEVSDDTAGGYDSAKLGNHGAHCSLTLECQQICNWFSI